MASTGDFVSFIGAGNVAWHLAPALDNAGFAVKEVFSREKENAKALVDRLYQADAKSTLDFSGSVSEVFIIAVSDDAIEEVSRELILPDDAILVHTSGSVPLSSLGYAPASRIGVFYPLQTFSKQKKVEFGKIPLFIETENAETERILMRMARAISGTVNAIDARDRITLHLAAVFASNFSNHMLTIAKELLEGRNLKFSWLKPLVSETLEKSLAIDPDKSQTGPARRGDLHVLDSHIEMLGNDKRLAEIYRVMSQHILDKYQPE